MYLNKPFMSKEKNSHCINNYLISSKFFYNSVSLNKYFFHFMFHMENGTITNENVIIMLLHMKTLAYE